MHFYAFYVLFLLFCVWNKKGSIFMRIKTSKRKKIACLTFCAFCAFYAFYAHKKHLRGGKSLVWRFVLFVLFMLFVLLVRVKSFRKKKNKLPWYSHLHYYSISLVKILITTGIDLTLIQPWNTALRNAD